MNQEAQTSMTDANNSVSLHDKDKNSETRFQKEFNILHAWLGRLLKGERQSRGLTTYEVEAKTGIGRNPIRDIENAKRGVDLRSIYTLFRFYELPFKLFDDAQESENLDELGSDAKNHFFIEAHDYFDLLDEDEQDELLVSVYSRAYAKAKTNNDVDMMKVAKERFTAASKRRVARLVEKDEKV